MTTIGVSTYRHDNPKEVFVPSYSYRFPAGRRVQLAAIKEGIFHPRLPSIRQMARDSNMHKLSDEHSRSSVNMEPPADFKRATTAPGSFRYSYGQMPNFGEGRNVQKIRYQYSPEELTKTREEWSDFLNRCPERFNIWLTEHPDTANTPYTGYAMRYLKPEVTARWRYTLQQEPSLNKYGPNPTPANSHNRYRDTHTRSRYSVSAEPWR